MQSFDANHPRLVPLSRKVALELVTLAVLMPLAVADIAAPIDKKLYCTDASLKKGAILETSLEDRLMQVLYRATINKGSYTRMLSPSASILKAYDLSFEEDEDEGEATQKLPADRPIAFSFEFIEVYAGSSKITKYLAEMGVICGPALDLSLSEEYDLRRIHVISWLTFLVAERRLRSFVLEPPCTTFSIMRRPRLRSKTKPLGFMPREPKTHLGNLLSCRSGQLMYTGARHNAIGLLETPYSSYLETYDAFRTVRCDSCRYGSEHLKSFRFLCLNLGTSLISDRCCCTTNHVRIQGTLTKGSAIYTDKLAECIARSFYSALTKKDDDGSVEKSPFGLESLLVNDIMQTSKWKEASVWTFKKESHINILEEPAILRLVSRIARSGRTIRSIVITDSNVVKCATAKGRTSSRGLGPILRRVCSLCVAAGIYLNVAYIPTRLNCADDPTRDVLVRPPVSGLGLSSWSSPDLFKLSLLGRYRRWTSNWLRLCIMLMGPSFIHIGDRSLYPVPWDRTKKASLIPGLSCDHGSLDFDASLGFPGEGPLTWLIWFFSVTASLWTFSVSVLAFALLCLLTWISFSFACWWGVGGAVPSLSAFAACRCAVGCFSSARHADFSFHPWWSAKSRFETKQACLSWRENGRAQDVETERKVAGPICRMAFRARHQFGWFVFSRCPCCWRSKRSALSLWEAALPTW